jgi:hypothetical protein
MEIRTRRRRALSTALALFLAIESVAAVAAVGQVSRAADAGTRHALPDVAPAGAVLGERAAALDEVVAPAARSERSGLTRSVHDLADSAAAGPQRRQTAATAPIPDRPPRAAAPTLKPPAPKVATVKAQPASGGTKTATAATYKGRNHVWIPALRINKSVHAFPCDRSRPPDNYVYRWGCAGRNNVYLLGHAHSVFKPLHDAYVGGRLKVGMKAYYADSKGKVHVYRVKWWKLTRPVAEASWAWAGQSVPSMTLQTCVGRNSEFRLMVRLVEIR